MDRMLPRIPEARGISLDLVDRVIRTCDRELFGKTGVGGGGRCAGVSVDDGSTTRMTESNGTQNDQHLNGLGGYCT
jgi:hypothetical protein